MNASQAAALTQGTGESDIVTVTIKAISSDQAIELFIAATDEA